MNNNERSVGKKTSSLLRFWLRCLLVAAIALFTMGQGSCPTTAILQITCLLTRVEGRDCSPTSIDSLVNGLREAETSGFPREAFAPGFTPVNVFAVDTRTGNFFVGGFFDSADNVRAYGIAYYDTVTDRWSALTGLGLRGIVHTLAISGNYLYVGGNFTQTYDGSVTNLNGVARYDIDAKTWSPLAGNGLQDNFGGPATVNTLTISGDDLIVGGRFLQTFDNSVTNLKSIARYNLTTNTWSALSGNGLSDGFGNGQVNSLIISGNELIVGGFFSQTVNGAVTNLRNIARFNTLTNTWSALAGNGLSGDVGTMAISGNNLFVGGNFVQTFDGSVTNLWRIARYNISTNTWSSLTGTGLNITPYSLLMIGDFLYVGGPFSQTQDGSTTNLNRIARYNTLTNTWSTLAGNGLNDSVGTMANISGSLYVGGKFSQTFDGSTMKNANRVARYDLSNNVWSKLGLKNGKALDGTVNALAVDASGNVYAGGFFTQSADGTTNLNRIARFDPTTKTWSALTNNGLNGTVYAVAVSGDNLYVGGIFTATFDSAVTNLNNIARYNLTTSTWSALAGNGLNNGVFSLASSGDTLYAGGFFSMSANGATTNLRRIARYNLTANTWSSLTGNGLNSTVFGLAVSGDNLYAGGSFSQTFDGAVTNLNRIVRYNIVTNTWSPLANNGLNSDVFGVSFSDGFLGIRGSFSATADSSLALNQIARYDTIANQWLEVTANPQGLTSALATNAAVFSGNELYLGGSFKSLGGGVANYFARICLQAWKVSAATSDWHTVSNWETNSVPAFNSNAVIPEDSNNINISSADVTLGDLTVSDGTLDIGAGRTLTINGNLYLNGGSITGDGTLVIANCQSEGILNNGATSYIQATLVRCVDNADTFIFPVGTANGYSPVTIKGVTGTGNISIKAKQGAYSNPAVGLPDNRVARWWQVENPGGGVTEADVFFNYLDKDYASTEPNYKAYRISGGIAQMILGSANTLSNYVSAENVTQFSDWTLADAAAPTETPTSTPFTASINGSVTYANAIGLPDPRFVSNVLISSTSGSPSVSTTTGVPGVGEGSYTLTGFGAGAYSITPTKTTGQNGISSFDAARISQHVAGPPNPQLNATQLIVADVSGNTSVTSFDAAMIAKFVAGPPYIAPGIGSTATWRFTPVNRNYASVTSSISGEDFSALLMGEITGNWNNTGARPADSWPLAVAVGRQTTDGKEIVMPVNVDGIAGKGVISYEFDLSYDPSVMRPAGDVVDVKDTISRGLSFVVNAAEQGLLRVVVYGAYPIDQDGVLLNLRFTAVGKERSMSPITFARFLFNESEPMTLTDGRVELR